MAKNFTFNEVPTIRHGRSRFDLSHIVKTSGNVGTLYPFEVQEVYPGDTFKVNANIVSRLSSSFIRPVMDNLFLDTYWFFVPSRLLYDKFVNVFGENTESAWANTQEYQVPSVPSGQVVSKSVGDYLTLPVGFNASALDVTVLPFRAFAKVYNEWFRDQNNVDPMHIQTGEVTSSEVLDGLPWAPGHYTGMLPKVGKLRDYFTTALPAPQKGDPVSFNLAAGMLPVRSTGQQVGGNFSPIQVTILNDGEGSPIPSSQGILGYYAGNSVTTPIRQGMAMQGNNVGIDNSDGYTFSNLWADPSSLQAISVNELRYAFQLQKMLERDVNGSRFVEYLSAHFGVSAGDYRLQRSEFLGGRRTPINIQQVVQSTGFNSTKANNELSQVGAYSLTNGKTRFTKSFVEHGFVIGVFCIRQFHTYQQGVEKFWRRRKREEFFDPVFSNIGYQPIYKTELFYNSPDGEPFGYNEAWADLRFRPNRVTGQMRSGITDSLDIWHFADDYANAPTLNKQFIEETPNYVDRAITVDSSEQDQFILDFYIQNIAYRCLPTFSTPSLIDHN